MTHENKINIVLIIIAAFAGVAYGMYEKKLKQPAETLQTLTVKTTLSGEFSENQFSQALELLKSNCPALFNQAVPDIESATAFSYNTDYTYFKDAYGWDKLIEVNIQLKDKLNHISPSYKAAGHKLNFYLGSGQHTGIVTDKRQTQKICGWEVTQNGDNMLHEAKELEILKKAD